MNTIQFIGPVTGTLLPIAQVPDPVFAEEMLGTGFAINPADGVLYAPFSGVIKQLAVTGHSVTMVSENGAEVLMHIGVDTVGLKGVGFTAHVQLNQTVQAGTPLITFDLPYLSTAAPCSWVIFVLLNSDEFDWHWAQTLPCEVTALLPSMVYLGGKGSVVVPKEVSSDVVATGVACVRHASGLHARPAALVQKVAKTFAASIQLTHESSTANAKSTLDVLMLNVPEQAIVTIHAQGVDAEQAVQAIVQVLEHVTHAQATTSEVVTPISPVGLGADVNAHVGVVASSGLAIGRVVRLKMDWPEFDETFSQVADEQQRVNEAFSLARNHLLSMAAASQNDEAQNEIQTAHLSLLEDDVWRESIMQKVAQSVPAGQAVRTCTQQLMNQLASSNLAVFRERANDLKDIATQVLYALMPQSDDVQATVSFPEGTVLVAEDLLPSVLMSESKHNIVAMVTANGGTTSHVAIMARALGIPFLVAIGNDVLSLIDGQEVMVDAEQGWIKPEPTESEKQLLAQRLQHAKIQQQVALSQAHLPATTIDGRLIEVAANISHADEAGQAFDHGADGVGLVRTELLFMTRSTMPTSGEQLEHYQAITEQLKGKKAIIRTLDVGADKQLSYVTMPREENPSLGMRGIRLGLARTEILDAQLTALLQVKPASSCRIMLPMVSDVAEVLQVRARLNTLAEQLNVSELPELGIMIEVPSAALLTDQLGEHVDFFSMGTNDLTQYVLAMDRCQTELASKLDGLHPAVLRTMAHACRGAAKYDKWVGVCGALAEEVLAIPVLIGLGVTELSVGVLNVPQIKALVRRCSYSSCVALAEECLSLTSAQAVRARLQLFMAAMI